MSLSGSLSNYELYQTTLQFFLAEENDAEARDSLYIQVESHLGELANPDPCRYRPKNAAFRFVLYPVFLSFL